MKLFYNVSDKPKFPQILLFAFQQLLAILAATIVVPVIINNSDAVVAAWGSTVNLSPSAALFGAGAGTLIYLLFTKFKSPVFLGSSFAFLGSMAAAMAGAVTVAAGCLGLILGAILAGLVYVILALLVKAFGVAWINKLMPAVVIGPTVAIIGLSLAGNAIGDLSGAGWWGLLVGILTLLAVIVSSVFGKKMIKTIPFVIGIACGYILATILTVSQVSALIDFSKFQAIEWVPSFTFLKAFVGFKDFSSASQFFAYLGTVAIAYVPVAFVVFAEHIADHKNLSTIIEKDLLTDPGLDKTLLGDGVGSMVGAVFGGCPNTTYGESIGCVAISGNASVITIVATSVFAMIASFIGPFATFLSTIPSCVMGGVCIALYGFIAVSGLKMLQGVDLGDNRNLFVVSVILISGVGGLALTIGQVHLTTIACSLILGIIVNLICSIKKEPQSNDLEEQPSEEE